MWLWIHNIETRLRACQNYVVVRICVTLLRLQYEPEKTVPCVLEVGCMLYSGYNGWYDILRHLSSTQGVGQWVRVVLYAHDVVGD